MKRSSITVIILLVSLLDMAGFASKPAAAQPLQLAAAAQVPADKPTEKLKEAWEANWAKTLTEAKREGKVTIYTVVTSTTKAALSSDFKKKYGIELEFVVGRGNEIDAKITTERNAGLFLADFYLGGANTATGSFKTKGYLAGLKPLLVLPEIADPKAWYGGSLVFIDKERQYVACPILTASNNYNSINTNLVKTGEFESYKDMLNPKWKGKIVMNDPTTTGAGSRWFAVVADQIMGLDFMRELVKNEPVITRDQRLQLEGLAKGKYAIAIGPQTGLQADFIKAGAPIKTVIPKEGGWLGAGSGVITYFKNAPHPNATKVFANWFLSREGQTSYSISTMAQSGRLDVSTDHMDKADLRVPGAKYFNSEDEEFLIKMAEYQNVARQVLGPLLK